ncbi:N-acetylglucosamine-1-phosphotransferase subunit gamma isoform X1 [Lingula anatina]|uniref:N-acetylglucosamine-1-phosphotransferase subunit gamma isoform X1 n=1 Tax=Lingula anatina TaxID=7574 RepID=A0A1S3JPG3_LINAN|nr:N-acetylglucosamine-1-phosphotransferase subunit gamma isoform X1 [Lingula anatina]|eukprot:XP_013412255.1 N-acetylglucosamine-1-phosphotransferase subunit gamma isoform X1 [Lingula anatina]
MAQDVNTILCIFVLYLSFKGGQLEKISMKIVEEPSNFGSSYGQDSQTHSLTPKVKPANFSGPPHLKRLYGKCFEKLDENYRYEFCPFINLTQHELALRWNPYSGILGIWEEWEIKNNTFIAMLMKNGDDCGDLHRSVKVIFHCGKTNEITEVTEPETCKYLLNFSTPLVCHDHSMLVYPVLSPELREKWNLLEGDFLNEEVTSKGYNKELRHIFEEAGFYMSKKVHLSLSKEDSTHNGEETDGTNSENLDTLDKCLVEYHKLKQEIEGLRVLVALQGKNQEQNIGSVTAKEEYYEDIIVHDFEGDY